MRVTITRSFQGRRQHWAVNPAGEKSGPWCIQLAHPTEAGHHFDLPKPEHSNFPTKKAALEYKRKNLS